MYRNFCHNGNDKKTDKKEVYMDMKNNEIDNISDIVIYKTDDGLIKVEVNLKDENIWLSIDQMAILFDRDRSVIGKHIRNIFEDGELYKESVWANCAHTASENYFK